MTAPVNLGNSEFIVAQILLAYVRVISQRVVKGLVALGQDLILRTARSLEELEQAGTSAL